MKSKFFTGMMEVENLNNPVADLILGNMEGVKTCFSDNDIIKKENTQLVPTKCLNESVDNVMEDEFNLISDLENSVNNETQILSNEKILEKKQAQKGDKQIMMSNPNEIEDSKVDENEIQSVRNHNTIKLKLMNLSSNDTAKTPICRSSDETLNCRSSDDSVSSHILEMSRNLEYRETVDNYMSLMQESQSYFPVGAILTRSKGKKLE